MDASTTATSSASAALWLQSDLAPYLATFAQAALTFVAIVVSVGLAAESERRASSQAIRLMDGQLLARKKRLDDRHQRLTDAIQKRKYVEYVEQYGLWHACEIWGTGPNIVQPPTDSDLSLFGSSAEAALRSLDQEPVSEIDFGVGGLSALAPFLRECRAVASGQAGHKSRLPEARLHLRSQMGELGSRGSLEHDLADVESDISASQIEASDLQSLRASLTTNVKPVRVLTAALLACGILALAALLFDLVSPARQVLALVSFAALLVLTVALVRRLSARVPDESGGV